MTVLTCQRDRFDIPDDVAYLNCAYMGPLSHEVTRAGVAGLELKKQPWTVKTDDFFSPVERVRELFAQIVDADGDGVAVLPAVSYGIAIAATNLPFEAGQRIVLLDEEFPSNVYAWHLLAAERGGEVITVACPPGDDWTSAVCERIDERTAIVSLPHCHWTDGTLLDLVAIGRRVREVGAALVIDGTQSIGAMPFDVEAIRPDFVVTAGYKWLLGPYAGAFMWCAPERRSGRPLENSWITRRNSEDFAGLIDYESEYRPGARRYDVGQTSNFALIPAFAAAFEQTLAWGVDRISAYARTLNEKIAAAAEGLGLEVKAAEHRAPHLLGVRLHGLDPEAVAAAMAESGVWVSVRGTSMRVAPHVYNNEDDVDRLIEALKRTL